MGQVLTAQVVHAKAKANSTRSKSSKKKNRLDDVALERDDGRREPRGNESIRWARATLIGVGNVVHVCARRDFRSFKKQKRSRSGIPFANLGRSLTCVFEPPFHL